MRDPEKYLVPISHRTYAIVLAAVALASIGIIAAVNYLVDPLQRFRTATFYPPQFDTQQRLQAPALARSSDYDAVILGTSTAENVFAADANSILDGRFLRLPISGGSPREQRLVLDVALDTGKPKHVLWFIDGFVLTQPRDLVREDFGPFPYYMYARGLDGILRYLMNFETFVSSIGIVVGLVRDDLPPARDLDRLNAWIDGATFGRDRVMSAYHAFASRMAWAQVIDRRMFPDPSVAMNSIEANIANVARANPGLRFDFVLVPPSDAQLAFWAAYFPAFLEAVLGARRELARQVSNLPNVVVHDFWQDTAIGGDLDRYSDMIHFDLRTTREILIGVASGRYRADSESIANGDAALRARIATFRAHNPAN